MGQRCPGRRSWPATGPGPGSCPSAAPAVGCSLWAAAGAPAPGGASLSRVRGETCRARGPQRSRRGGLMTPSCPHPWPPRLLTTPGGCGPFPGGLAARCCQTRPCGELPAGHLASGRARATSGQPWSHPQPQGDRARIPWGQRSRPRVRRGDPAVLSRGASQTVRPSSPCPAPSPSCLGVPTAEKGRG